LGEKQRDLDLDHVILSRDSSTSRPNSRKEPKNRNLHHASLEKRMDDVVKILQSREHSYEWLTQVDFDNSVDLELKEGGMKREAVYFFSLFSA
jgi:hypothetical protein